MPVPDSATICGLAGSPSEMLRFADLVPAADGVNVTLIVHDAPALSDVLQLFVCVKSPPLVPVMVMPIEVPAAVGFVTVTVWAAAAVPTSTGENVSEAGETVSSTVPVPVSETRCGLPLVLSAIFSEAVRGPVQCGVKVTVNVQVSPAGTKVPQSFV